MKALLSSIKRLSLQENQQLYLLSIIVGLLAGSVAILFELALHYCSGTLLTKFANLQLTHPHGEHSSDIFHFEAAGDPILWLIVLLPALGGLLSGWICYKFSPESAGTGTDAMIEAFHNKVGKISPIVPLVKGITTIITLSTGGSSGKEGPVAQIGAGLGSALAVKLGIGVRARRTLLLAGTSAGLGAIFQAPLGAALTAVEVLYHEDIESDSLIPCVISSITAYALFGTVFGFSHILMFSNSNQIDFHTSELFIFVFMGLVCSAIGWIYVKVFFGTRNHIFQRISIKPWLKPGIGGLCVGLLGLISFNILGSGLGYVQELIEMSWEEMTWTLVLTFLGLALLKILATSFTISSGGSGGVFAPSLFIGSLVGATVGGCSYLLFPSLVTSPFGAFVIVGMCSFFAGVAHAPIAAVIMICEMTGGYELLAPCMLVSVLAIILSQKWSIYEKQVRNKFFSKAHVGDMTIDVLQDLDVSTLAPYRQVGVTSSHTLFHTGEEFGQKIHASDLVLVDHDDIYAGMVSLRDVHFDSTDPLIANLITLEDIMTPNIKTLTPEHNLHEALELLLRSEFDKVPVLRSHHEDVPHLLGYVSYSDVLEKYHEIVNPNRVG